MSKRENLKMPQIRFKAFKKEWVEELLLSRITKIIDFRGRTPKKLGLDWSETGYLALSALNVKDGYIDRSTDAHFGDEALYNVWMKDNELHCNQVLFTTEAPMGNVAQIPDTQKYILSQRAIAFVTDANRLSEDYLATLLKAPSVSSLLTARSSGGTAKGVSQKSLSTLEVVLSDEIGEQAKIGLYFKEMDHLIQQHQHKHEKLVTLKQAMLQKMFPQHGTTIPKIRFKGFEREWGEQQLCSVVEVCSGRDYKHLCPGDIPVYGTGGYMLSVNKALSYDKDAVGIGRKGTIDRPYLLKCPFWTVDTLFYAIPKKGHNLDFIYSIFQKIDWKKYDESTGVPSLSKTAINEIGIAVPTLEEQQKIGCYFRQLDELISRHAIQLEKLKQVKSACLAKMFV